MQHRRAHADNTGIAGAVSGGRVQAAWYLSHRSCDMCTGGHPRPEIGDCICAWCGCLKVMVRQCHGGWAPATGVVLVSGQTAATYSAEVEVILRAREVAGA